MNLTQKVDMVKVFGEGVQGKREDIFREHRAHRRYTYSMINGLK